MPRRGCVNFSALAQGGQALIARFMLPTELLAGHTPQASPRLGSARKRARSRPRLSDHSWFHTFSEIVVGVGQLGFGLASWRFRRLWTRQARPKPSNKSGCSVRSMPAVAFCGDVIEGHRLVIMVARQVMLQPASACAASSSSGVAAFSRASGGEQRRMVYDGFGEHSSSWP